VEQIAKAQIPVDLNGRNESISQNFKFTLCNEAGEPVDAELITVNTQEIHLELKIQRVKEVKLTVTIVDGGGATAQTATYDINPQTIKVSGSDAALENLGDEIVLGTINLRDYAKNAKITLTIPEYEGVTNLSNITEVTVDLEFIGLSTKEFVLDQFRLLNIPEGLTAEVITEQLTVVIRGRTADVAKLTAQDITVSVDFAEAVAGTSTYRVTITFSEAFTDLGALGSYSISVTLTEAEE
jgi:YbbR domain-containing protein